MNLNDAKKWLSNYLDNPRPENFLVAVRPLLRDIAAAMMELEEQKDVDGKDADGIMYQYLHLIGFIGGALAKDPEVVM